MRVDARTQHDLGVVAASLVASLAIHAAVLGVILPLIGSSAAAQARIDAVLLAARTSWAAPEPPAPRASRDGEGLAVPESPSPDRPASSAADLPAKPRPVAVAKRAPAPPATRVPAPRTPSAAPAAGEPAASPEIAPSTDRVASVPRPQEASDSAHEAVARPVTPPSFRADHLANPPPAYPRRARRDGIEGTVMLKVLVTAAGAAGRVEVETSSGSSALDRAALNAVKTWRFVPARRGEESVDAWVRVPVKFRLESG